ncbi:hypothetical protein C0995_009610 [Termitomyces sp. Mi166|nr:hypothetical protein C0995_009610 [Termitomyces sp. Mi166\
MALATVVSGFEIASTVGTYAGLLQNHLNKDNRFCRITASLSQTTANLLLALEGLCTFADILTEDESGFIKDRCKIISDNLESYQDAPIPKKFFRKTQDYKDYLAGVQDLRIESSKLLVRFKELSSNAAIRMAQMKRVEQQDREAREARKNFLEDIRYWTTVKQLDLSCLPNSQGPFRHDPFADEASAAWAEPEPLKAAPRE